ncbi:co-chaperone YbbN [Vibrio mangrovi]|uniref:Co-chaperone YbbN n=1 Tax=Vibrio mangrovi TaxID=474394 RepID=A0A1Y6IRX0_9VIBR|nr:co-chaperone YbbN [Vibrio mangrovi]MDW6003428.1 co-chaperone YbbN [Vibrio mangrovi]SMR99781.1 Thioredoxin-1 [Vibrio mangrovi]
MQTPHHVDVTQQNIRELLESSFTKPILFYFWAPMDESSAALIQPLQGLAQKYQGAFTLALLNCQEEQEIAAQFGIQAIPTLALFSQGRPVDGLGGPQSIESVTSMLEKHLPSQDEMNFQQALTLIGQEEYAQALPLLQTLPEMLREKGEVKLALASCLLETQQFEAAEAILQHIPLEFQDGDYKSLLAKLELHHQAANSPEIVALEAAFQESPQDLKLASELAAQYHQVQRDDEALELLWSFLRSDLNAQDGEMKKIFMDILSALGQGNPLASQYRRQLYSLLY